LQLNTNQTTSTHPEMKLKTKLAALALAFTAVVLPLQAQINITNADGSDGQLIVNSSTNIDLSQAGTGSWTTTSAKPGFGTYDPSQWAVVFKYSNVVISAGTTVTFSNNATRAPVVWLVNGNVTINGELNLDGQASTGDTVNLTMPGPGGFRGGGYTFGNGSGFGPGGSANNGVYSGSYGNQQLLPLIGGSGGTANGANGGAGGGAILIAASGTITINAPGICHANGGSGYYGENASGGGIRLVANQILGNGTITANGGANYGNGGPGIIRLESFQTASGQLHLSPNTPAVQPDVPPKIFPGTNAPTASIVSIVSQPNQTNTVPNEPKAAMSSAGNDDLTLITTNSVIIQVRTTNFPTNGTVVVFIKPLNAPQSTPTATYVSGDTNAAIWQVSTILNYQINQGHTLIQARAFH
jgi:plastocyanin